MSSVGISRILPAEEGELCGVLVLNTQIDLSRNKIALHARLTHRHYWTRASLVRSCGFGRFG